MAEPTQYCTFFLEGNFFGVDVSEVQEVIRYQEMTEVPLAPKEIKGLINLRGQIVTAIDMRRRLDLPERPTDRLPMNVVVRTEEIPVSLLVDEIGDVIEVDEDHFELPPETIQGTARVLIKGVYKLEEQLLLVLDTKKTVNIGAEA